MNVLVLGIGNLLLSDEAAGVKAVEEFARNYALPAGVEVLDGGTCGIELLHYIEGRDCVIVVDVVKTGNPPGAIVRLEGKEVPAFFTTKISPHQLGLSDMLAAAQLSGRMPAKVVLLGIEPKKIETGLELSNEINAKIGELADLIAKEVESLGLKPLAKGKRPEAN